MNADALITTSGSDRRSVGEMLAELIPLVDVVPGEGPPVIFLMAPWLLLVLMLSGPFAFLVILVVFMVVAATVLAALATASLAVPYLLVRLLRRRPGRHAPRAEHTAHLVPVESPRGVA